MPQYKDLHDRDEDARIQEIGETVMKLRKTVAFITDADPGKAERYVTKLRARFPGIIVLATGPGPVKGTTMVKVGPPGQNN